jgi:cobalt-zinc-cadmium efflux system membrane fusion protein
MSGLRKLWRPWFISGAAVVLLAALAIAQRERWPTWFANPDQVAGEHGPDRVHAGHEDAGITALQQPLRLAPQAQKNLGLVSKPVSLTTYWRKIDVPGMIVDRPGVSDRDVVAPVTGIVTRIHAYPGDTVEPGSPLISIRLVSESLHASQLELFKATRQIEIAKGQLQRLSHVTESGALPKSRTIEIENQIRLLEATVQAYRQDLQARGLSTAGIADAARGEFVAAITINAPSEQTVRLASVDLAKAEVSQPRRLPFSFELHELKVELGQQVQAGQVLCGLADHRTLLIEGRGFKDDMPLIQEAARNGWDVEVEFDQRPVGDWPPTPQKLPIHNVANTIDAQSRTFAFFLVLENSWQAYTRNGQTRLLWRFRPGDRVRLRAAVDKLENVLVVPKQGVVREGPEAYVFRQNGDLFDRKPVHVLHEDRLNVVLANDGSVRPGFYVVQNAAASLNRVLKAQAASGTPAKLHVHADGTVHGAH